MKIFDVSFLGQASGLPLGIPPLPLDDFVHRPHHPHRLHLDRNTRSIDLDLLIRVRSVAVIS